MNENKKIINWCILIILALIWGSSFILMKRGMIAYTSEEVAALRIFIAFIVLLPLSFKHIKRLHIRYWPAFLGMGLFGNFIPAFLFTKAETVISSSLAGMLNSLTPLFTLLLGIVLFKVKTGLINGVGIFIGFIGAIGLFIIGKEEDMAANFSYGLFVVVATLCYALSVNIIKKFLNDVPPVTATVWAFLFIGPMAGIYLFGKTDFVLHFQQHPKALYSLGFISILAIFGTAVSVIIFNMLIRNTNALFASSVTYLIPIVAMCWGIFDAEPVLLQHVFWIIVILLGVALVNRKPETKATETKS